MTELSIHSEEEVRRDWGVGRQVGWRLSFPQELLLVVVSYFRTLHLELRMKSISFIMGA